MIIRTILTLACYIVAYATTRSVVHHVIPCCSILCWSCHGWIVYCVQYCNALCYVVTLYGVFVYDMI